MIRLIGAAMIIAASAAAGAYINMRLLRRLKYIEGIIASMEQLKSYICFCDYSMEKALLKADEVCGSGGIFKTAAENMKKSGLKKAFYDAVTEKKDKLCLQDDDADVMIVFAERLGLTDAEDQKKNIDSAIAALNIQRSKACDEYKKKGRLFRSSAALLGTLTALMLL